MRAAVWGIGFALLSASATGAAAAESLTFQAGSFDTFHGTESSLIGFEYTSHGHIVAAQAKELGETSFITGGSVTGRFGGYLYAGGRFEIPIGQKLSVAPSFAPGVFFAGRGMNLGGSIEFRSGVEAALGLNDGAAVGLALYHYSNGRLYPQNPGSEAIMAIYRFPVLRSLGL